ncbi:hypothetical protein AVEN_8072-1 [Araneus ventricosus]|uniref:Uncharacterized protein n=1 Tax=Araneus ventricosus TaxID=182803 RepID=A0A4Y2NA39_ARAVE|nr:hypothetical protein AVEN_8072-1 [Araneus ventricosus]
MYQNLLLLKRKRQKKTRSTSLKDAENKTNSIVASKFCRTSLLQDSTPTSVHASYSRKLILKADGATGNDHDNLTSAVDSRPEPMATDNENLDNPETEIESDNAIEYNPIESIDEILPVPAFD